MALTQREEMQAVTVRNVNDYCIIECQCATIVEDADGNVVASQRKGMHHMPTDDLSECPAQVQAIAAVVFTDDAY